MDIILNYIFIGFAFTFFVDLLLLNKTIRNHIEVKNLEWNITQRVICILVWPIGSLIFLISFFKSFFK